MAAVCRVALYRKTRRQVRNRCAAILAGGVLLVLAGCGGGGGGSGPPDSIAAGGTTFVPNVFQPSANFKSQCTTAAAQNNYLRSWTNETYLWYSEVVDANPAQSTTSDYFKLMKTLATTASGNAKDRFHFTYSTAEWQALSQSGIEAGYGVQWLIAKGQAPGRQPTEWARESRSVPPRVRDGPVHHGGGDGGAWRRLRSRPLPRPHPRPRPPRRPAPPSGRHRSPPAWSPAPREVAACGLVRPVERASFACRRRCGLPCGRAGPSPLPEVPRASSRSGPRRGA